MKRAALVGSTAATLALALSLAIPATAAGQDRLDKLVRVSGPAAMPGDPVEFQGRFSGYTNYWQSIAWRWEQYGNLFLIGQPDVAQAIAQNKADIAEELGLPGLILDEGFISAYLETHPAAVWDPEEAYLRRALEGGDVLVYDRPSSPLGAKLLAKAPGLLGARAAAGSHQARAAGYRDLVAFVLGGGDHKLFVVLTEDAPAGRDRFRALLGGLSEVVSAYDLR
ncbi:MAG TPA: hypothetical protein VLN41_00020, partial [Candidatus Bathyarchaeia archaeon]|nr:hypothetical protein [Candidatus Bathyarchaeia archaeon]